MFEVIVWLIVGVVLTPIVLVIVMSFVVGAGAILALILAPFVTLYIAVTRK